MTPPAQNVQSAHKMRTRRYTHAAMLLHWLTALIIISQYFIAPFMTWLTISEASLKFSLYQLHKSFGITILLLTMVRVLWWFFNRHPPAMPTLSHLERRLSKGMHLILYGFMFAVPLLGWAMVSASPLHIPTLLFGKFTWPHISFFQSLADSRSAEALLKSLHQGAAYFMLVLLLFHIFAALRHQFILRDGLIYRILPAHKNTDWKPLR